MAFAIKAAIADPGAEIIDFPAQKTMYGGKWISAGDVIFIFASENHGGRGLWARGTVAAAEPVPRNPGLDRQTPRVGILVRREALATRPLGRVELTLLSEQAGDGPPAELHFMLYRQATDKIVGLSEEAAAYLAGFFWRADQNES